MNGYKVYSVKNDTRYNKLLLEISYITLSVLSTINPFYLIYYYWEGQDKLQFKSYKNYLYCWFSMDAYIPRKWLSVPANDCCGVLESDSFYWVVCKSAIVPRAVSLAR